jgi:predicted RNA-binding protein with PUA domain
MSCDHLICARCASPVAEGRCPACRAARDEIHHTQSSTAQRLLIAGALAVVLTLLLVVLLARYGH